MRKKLSSILRDVVSVLDLKHHDSDIELDVGPKDLVRVCGVPGLKDYLSSNIVKGRENGGGYSFFSEGKPGQKYINTSGDGILVIRRAAVREEEFSLDKRNPAPLNEIIAHYHEVSGAIGGGGSKIVVVHPFKDAKHQVEAYYRKDGKYVRVKSLKELADLQP